MPPAPLSRSDKSCRTNDSPITFYVQKALEDPTLISFAAGLVDEVTLPAEEIGQAVAEIMADPVLSRSALQYGSTQGVPTLRKQVLERICAADGLKPADLNLTTADVCITTGSQQLLYLLGEILFNPGDIVITEAPSYFVYHCLLQSHGARVLTVPMDENGMDVSALETLLERLKRSGELDRVKVIYTVDYFQNPTGLTLSLDRREKLVGLVQRYSASNRIFILEDAAYRELRYSGDDLPSLKSYDTRNETVIYAGTFSKACSPGLKTGYALVPRDLMGPMMHLKGSHDFGSGNLAQYIVLRLLTTGVYGRHVEKLRSMYRQKRDTLVGALEREFGDFPGASWTVPSGGLFSWLSLDGVNTGPGGKLVQAALDAGVMYVPGEFGHVSDESGSVPNTDIRLCFGVATPKQIVEGIHRLRKAVNAVSAQSGHGRRVKAVSN